MYSPYLPLILPSLLPPATASHLPLLPSTSRYCLPPPATASYLQLLPSTSSYYLPPPASAFAPPQVHQASPQLIMLDSITGWGVNGSLVTLLPDQVLPLPTPPLSSTPPPDSSSDLSFGALAGVVVGGITGAVLLLGGITVLLLKWRCAFVCSCGAEGKGAGGIGQ